MSLTDERIGHIIRLERHKKRMTVAEVGKLIGVDHSTVSQYSAGSRRVPAERAEALARVFGIPVKLLDREAYAGADSVWAVDSLAKNYEPGREDTTTLPDALAEIERLRGLVRWSVMKLQHFDHYPSASTLAKNLDASPNPDFRPGD